MTLLDNSRAGTIPVAILMIATLTVGTLNASTTTYTFDEPFFPGGSTLLFNYPNPTPDGVLFEQLHPGGASNISYDSANPAMFGGSNIDGRTILGSFHQGVVAELGVTFQGDLPASIGFDLAAFTNANFDATSINLSLLGFDQSPLATVPISLVPTANPSVFQTAFDSTGLIPGGEPIGGMILSLTSQPGGPGYTFGFDNFSFTAPSAPDPVVFTGNVVPDPTTTTINDDLRVGDTSDGTMTISNGGAVASRNGFIAYHSGVEGTVTVSGDESVWTNSGSLRVGNSGHGTLDIINGGQVSNTTGYISRNTGAIGVVTVDGNGSTWTNSGQLVVGTDTGSTGSGHLSVTNGGSVTSAWGEIGFFGSMTTGTATVSGTGSSWTNSGSLFVGFDGTGILNIENGGSVLNTIGRMGASIGTGIANITGAASTWINTGDLIIGGYSLSTASTGSGTVNINDGGAVVVGGILKLHPGGTLAGNGGTVEGNVSNAGLVDPGVSPGVLTIDGDFTQESTGSLLIELAGLVAGSEHDVLALTGIATLGGTIAVDLIDNFNPTLGDTFTILTFDQLIDDGYIFDFTDATLSSGLSWDTTDFNTTGTIAIIPEPASLALLGLGGLLLGLRRGHRGGRAAEGQARSSAAGDSHLASRQTGTVMTATLAGLLLAGTSAAHAQVTWETDGNGQWTDASNWSSNPDLPGAGDDVVIDRTGAEGRPENGWLVTLDSGSHTINSLVLEERLRITNFYAIALEVLDSAIINRALYLDGGTLRGGTWSGQGVARNTRNDSRLDGTTMALDVIVDNNTLRVYNGLTLDSSLSIERNDTSTVFLGFEGTQMLDGEGEIVFNGSRDTAQIHVGGGPGNTLTIGSDITIRTGERGGLVGSSVHSSSDSDIILHGTVSAQTEGRTIQIGSTLDQFTNEGTLEARNQGRILMASNAAHLTNLSTNTLTGGSYHVYANSTMDFGDATITTNAANILLDGPGSSFSAINSLTANASDGTFTLSGGRNFTTAGELSNDGLITVGEGSMLTITGDTLANHGTLAGSGMIVGDVVGVGLVSPGNSPGLLTIDGDFTQESTGSLLIELAGLNPVTEHDVLDVLGTATLGGMIAVELIDDFAPTLGDSFNILNFTQFIDDGFTFDFSAATLSSGLSWDTTDFATTGTIAVIPEPASLALLGLGGLVLLRRVRDGGRRAAGQRFRRIHDIHSSTLLSQDK